MTKKEKLAEIYKVIGQDRNVGDEYRGDFWIRDVMIGDVLQYYSDNTKRDYSGECSIYCDQVMKLTGERKDKRKTIDEQSDKCIEFVFSLIR